MAVRVFLDLDRLHLVANGERHRARLMRVPGPGELVVMLCGYADAVEYTHVPGEIAVRTCWPCDLAYRRQLGIRVLPGHPALEGRQ